MEAFLDPLVIDSVIKLFLAAVLGAAIGLERELHGRPAGLRTHALVCVASTMLVAISKTAALASLDTNAPGNYMFNVDPARMAAGIMTGIGFLGAGAILSVRDSLIRGLTTAACIWFVAALGVAIGFDAYILAIVAVAMALFILVGLNRVEGAMEQGSYRTLVVEIASDKKTAVDEFCRDHLKINRIRVQQASYELDNRSAEIKISFSLRLRNKRDNPELISEIGALDGVYSVRWL
jgi:putative Mg2+ transporter-C (MgtC) family protein